MGRASPSAVVLGLGQNGLATVRALGRRGVDVIAVESSLAHPATRSRYCRIVPCADLRSAPALLEALVGLGRTLDAPAVLLPSGDLNLEIVSEHREVLAPFYRTALPDRATVRLVLDKNAFYAFAERAGFAVPRTRLVTAETARAQASALDYPVLLKPRLRDAAWRRAHAVKLYEAGSPAQLVAHVEALSAVCADVLVQERIPGPDSRLVFSLTYLDAALRPLAMFTGRKLRQWPPRYGTSSLAESRWDGEVAELSLRVLRALGHRGYGSVEFKRDPRDGRLKMIEVTGRTWYPHGLATACGVNLPWLAYRDLAGLGPEDPPAFPDGVRWIDEERDLRSAWQEYRAGDLDLRTWLGSYRGRRTWALAALDDPGPLLALGARGARAAGRRLARTVLEPRVTREPAPPLAARRRTAAALALADARLAAARGLAGLVAASLPDPEPGEASA